MKNIFDTDIWMLLAWNAGLLVAVVAGVKIAQLLLAKLFHAQRFFPIQLTECLIERLRHPLFWTLLLVALYAVLPFTALTEEWLRHLQALLKPLTVASLGWLVIGTVRAVGKWLETHYNGKQSRDSLGVRRFNTQIRILVRVVITVTIVLTAIGMALVVPGLREFGMSLFASAGVAGIVIGVAAKESLSNLIAGAQLALTQQILLGDEVVVQGEFGVVDEITSSYVTIKLWDLRRMIVPLRYFMENCFENWTYHEPDIMGTVFLYADYTVDIAQVRAEAERVTKASKHWDGKTCVLAVTNSKENTIELRVTVSARNSGDLWDLRCEVREKLVTYLQRAQALALPKTRVALQQPEAQHA